MEYKAGEGKSSASAREVRAQSVSLGDFSEQLTAGVLRAVDERAARQPRLGPGDPGGGNIGPPWIWFGYWIRVGGDIKLDREIDIKAFETE